MPRRCSWRSKYAGTVRTLLAEEENLSDTQLDASMASPAGRQVDRMMRYSAISDPATVRRRLEEFAWHSTPMNS